MIKNIPNKYTKEMLLENIDRKFYNAYDFFYLPMDLIVVIVIRIDVILDMLL